MTDVVAVAGTVVVGHGVASGRADDPRFPDGTIRAQYESFLQRGVDLTRFHPGTVNVSTGHPVSLVAPDRVLDHVTWHPEMPPETFLLWDIRLRTASREVEAMIYRPDPTTKPDHQQPEDVVEVLAPWLDQLTVGAEVGLLIPADRVAD